MSDCLNRDSVTIEVIMFRSGSGSFRLILCVVVVVACIELVMSANLRCYFCTDSRECEKNKTEKECDEGADKYFCGIQRVITSPETVIYMDCDEISDSKVSKSGDCRQIPGRGDPNKMVFEKCYCNDKDLCIAKSQLSSGFVTKPTRWINLLWIAPTCFYILFKGTYVTRCT